MLHLPYRELPVDDPGTPDTGSPLRYLGWLARHQKWLLSLNALFGIGWMVAQALVWAAVGAAIDHGVEHHDTPELLQVGRRRRSPRPDPGGLRLTAPPARGHQLDERDLSHHPGHRTTHLDNRAGPHRRDSRGRRRQHRRGRRDAHRQLLRQLRSILGRHRGLDRRVLHLAIDLGRARSRRACSACRSWARSPCR